jgi:SEC-C motif
MPIKKRDPTITGKIVHPWLPFEPCPCGSGKVFAYCCRQPDGGIYKTVALPIPPAPITGHARDGCYMNWTEDCSSTLSGEHFVSEGVLKLIGERHVAVNGTHWLAEGETRPLPIGRLVGNVLCTRHNSAMWPLDTAAVKFFGAIKSIYSDLGNSKTLSRKRQWWLLSGEEIELWLLKTAFGLYHSGNLAKDRKKLCDVQRINRVLMEDFQGCPVLPPCGMYLIDLENRPFDPNTLEFTSLSSDNNETMVGLRFRFLGISLLILLDPSTVYTAAFLASYAYRPNYLFFRNRNGQRTHAIGLTWPRRAEPSAVLFGGIGTVRG